MQGTPTGTSRVGGGGGGGFTGMFIRVWNFIYIFWLGVKWGTIEMLTRHRKLNLEALLKRTGQTVVITGATRGIGSQVVRQLMMLDFHIIIGCRNEGAGVDVIDKIRKEGIQTGSAEVLNLDLGSLSSVRRFAKSLLGRNIPINLLINNAGVMFCPHEITEDGFESQFQTNYLSHFLLTNQLLPLLEMGGTSYRTSRVVNVSSIAHFGGKINFEDINMTKMYDRHMAYMSSKLMQVVSARDLNSRLQCEGKPVQIYSLHPGFIYTDLYEHLWYFKPIRCLLRKMFKTTEQGADGIVYVSLSPEVETDGGQYFMNCRKQGPNPLAQDPSVQQRLWNASMGLVGLRNKKGEEASGGMTV